MTINGRGAPCSVAVFAISSSTCVLSYVRHSTPAPLQHHPRSSWRAVHALPLPTLFVAIAGPFPLASALPFLPFTVFGQPLTLTAAMSLTSRLPSSVTSRILLLRSARRPPCAHGALLCFPSLVPVVSRPPVALHPIRVGSLRHFCCPAATPVH
eukprot:7134681-Prymnesium_polylepis.1